MSFTGSLFFAAGLRSDAVSNATGRGWEEWFHILDSAGAGSLPHKDIESYLYETQGLSNWWSRMVANGYEQACGRRASRFQENSCTVSVSKSFRASADVLFKAWVDETLRERWLPGYPIMIRKAVPQRSMRITWTDEISGLVIEFAETGSASCRMEVRHVNLPTSELAGRMQSFWNAALERLAGLFPAHQELP